MKKVVSMLLVLMISISQVVYASSEISPIKVAENYCELKRSRQYEKAYNMLDSIVKEKISLEDYMRYFENVGKYAIDQEVSFEKISETENKVQLLAKGKKLAIENNNFFQGEYVEEYKYDLLLLKQNNTYKITWPKSPRSYLSEGYAALALHEMKKRLYKSFEQGYKYVDIAIELDPNNCIAYYVQAYIYKEQADVYYKPKQYERALESIDKSIELAEKKYLAAIYTLKGLILEKLKRYEEAIIFHNKASEIKPNYKVIQSNLEDSKILLKESQGNMNEKVFVNIEDIKDKEYLKALDVVKKMYELYEGDDKEGILKLIDKTNNTHLSNIMTKEDFGSKKFDIVEVVIINDVEISVKVIEEIPGSVTTVILNLKKINNDWKISNCGLAGFCFTRDQIYYSIENRTVK